MEDGEAPPEAVIDFVPAICFVKKGISKQTPDKIVLTPAEIARVITETRQQLRDEEEEEDDDDNEMETSDVENERPDNIPANPRDGDEFSFEGYDEEDTTAVAGIGDVADLDPSAQVEDEEDSEAEDEAIKPTDNLVLAGRVTDDYASMEVYVFNEEEGSLYVHHDFVLPSFPLCIEWLSHDPGSDKDGNMCAIGSMDPIITIWDLDIQDSLEPAFKLGSKGSRKKNKPKYGHTDAVLDLSWNTHFPHILASASVDQTVHLWDLDEGQPHTTITSFEEKVQSIAFHPTEAQSLLSGCSDGFVRLFDCRDPETIDAEFKSWKLSGEVEKVVWSPSNPNYFMAGNNTGQLYYFDKRLEEPLWSTDAHDGEISGINFSPTIDNLLTTTGSDGLLRIWKYDQSELRPVYSENMKMGRIQTMKPSPDDPFTFAFGGETKSNQFKIFNIKNFEAVRAVFGIETANMD